MTIYSKYKNTILNDKYSPFILAWIEKNGATSEEEIWFDTHIDRAILKNILVKLFDNEFITTYRNYFKISEQGKGILDKLEISRKLLKLTLDDLKLDNKEEEDESYDTFIVLENYRDNFYENYLNTQLRLNVWNRITNTKEFKNKSFEYKNFCKRVIISNDILKTYGDEKKSFRINSKEQKILELIRSTNSFEKLNKLSVDEEDTKFFIEFETINNILPSKKHNDTWFDVFTNLKSKDINERTLKSYNQFKTSIYADVKSIDIDNFKISLVNDPINNSIKPLYDTLFMLQSNDSIDELAKSLSISTTEGELIIQQLERLVKKYNR